jgi:mitochondrial fission protein ELM1
VLVKRNGQTWVLTINGNPRAAQALNGLTNPDVSTGTWADYIFKTEDAVNRMLSAMMTTYSPNFIVSNFARDTAYVNTMVWAKENKNYALAFHANHAK